MSAFNSSTPSENEHYDVIIIGTGAGGGTLAHRLAPSGKKILVLERGAFLPKEKANWSTDAVFRDGRYQTQEVWADNDGKDINPGIGYWVGGNTKVYGGASFVLEKKTLTKFSCMKVFHRLGRSSTLTLHPIMIKQSGCIRFMANRATTPLNRLAVPTILIHL